MRQIPSVPKLLPLILVTFTVAHAQTAPDAGSLQQQIERERRQILPRKVLPERPAEPSAMRPPVGATIVVTAFRFAGNTLFTAEQLAPAVAQFLNRPLDFAQLQAAAVAVAKVYREAGWIVRAYLPEQDIADGIVTIQVVEAVFGGVRLEGPEASRLKFSHVHGMFDAQQKTGEPLNADAIDRALLLAEDLPGVAVSGSLREGARKGESELVVRLADKPLVAGDAALDNTGSRSTGPDRLAVNISLGSPFGFGDLVSGSAIHTDGSDYLRLGATAPVGAYGWRVGGSASHLDYKLVSPDFLALNGKGSSDTVGLEASYALIRARLMNLYFNANLDHKAFDNQSGGAVTTHYQADTLTLGVNGNLFDNLGGGGANTANLAFFDGEVNLDGSPNRAADAATTRAAGRFAKLRYGASRQQVIREDLALFVAFSGQSASKNLDSSEKFYLGGASGVRAYPSSEGGGSDGRLFNLELRLRLPQGFNLAGFYDYGQVTVNRDNGYPGAPALNDFSLRGAGLSLAWQAGNSLSLKAAGARRIGSNPNPTATGNDQDGSLVRNRWWLTASLPF